MQRSDNLFRYLSHRLETASVLLIAEAPGYAGARFSGVAMTCERTLLDQKRGVPAAAVFPTPTPIPRTSSPGAGNNHMRRDFGFCENTATTVWGELLRRPGLRDRLCSGTLLRFILMSQAGRLLIAGRGSLRLKSKLQSFRPSCEFFPPELWWRLGKYPSGDSPLWVSRQPPSDTLPLVIGRSLSRASGPSLTASD
jgi:hypothetical protein